MLNNVNSPDRKRLGLAACVLAALAMVPRHLTAGEVVLHNFATSSLQGSNPYAGLLRDKAGDLYGTTVTGGAAGDSTVYRIRANGGETVLYSFTGPDGPIHTAVSSPTTRATSTEPPTAEGPQALA